MIVKLHDRSFHATERGTGGINWSRRIERQYRDGRVHLARASDVSPYLFVSDVLVTDHSSVGFEFMLLNRPIVTIDCPELIRKARINPDKVTLLRSAADVVADSSDVAPAVTRALTNPSTRSERRRAIAADLFFAPGGATARAATCIYDLLELEAPRLAGASTQQTCTDFELACR